jgi:hypothetical protein
VVVSVRGKACRPGRNYVEVGRLGYPTGNGLHRPVTAERPRVGGQRCRIGGNAIEALLTATQAQQVPTHAFEIAGDEWTRVSPKTHIVKHPARSTTLVSGLNGASILPLDPTATLVSPSTAIASTNPPAAEGEVTPQPCGIREGHVIWNPTMRPEADRCGETS